MAACLEVRPGPAPRQSSVMQPHPEIWLYHQKPNEAQAEVLQNLIVRLSMLISTLADGMFMLSGCCIIVCCTSMHNAVCNDIYSNSCRSIDGIQTLCSCKLIITQ